MKLKELLRSTPYSFVDSKSDIKIASSTALPQEKCATDVIQCDGTNDHLDIRTAINEMDEGETLELSTGLFNLGSSGITGYSTIDLISGITLKGQGKTQTKLLIDNGVQLNAIGASIEDHITLKDFEIDGNYNNNTERAFNGDERQNGIYFSEVTNSMIQNIYTHHNIFHGIFFFNQCNNNTVKNTDMAYNAYRAIHAHDRCNNNLYLQNNVWNNAFNPTETSGGGMFVVYNENCDNIISENIIVDDRLCGLDIQGSSDIGFGDCSGNEFSDNQIFATLSGSYGIVIGLDSLVDNLISGNIIRTVDAGIMCNNGYPSDLTIEENDIISTTNYGVVTRGNNHIIQNNMIYSQGISNPVLAVQYGSNCNIHGNIIKADHSIGGIQLKTIDSSIAINNIIGAGVSYCVAEKTGSNCHDNTLTPNTCS